MKIASYRVDGRDGIAMVGADETLLFDIAALWPELGLAAPAPHHMIELIESGPEAMAALRAHQPATSRGIPLGLATLLPPVRRPSKIICLALNNSANSDRILSGPSHPATFLKPASALLGHGGHIELRPSDGRVHPEPELAVIIGREGKRIAARDALQHVFGYTVHNDITGATMRGEDTFHYRAIHPAQDGSLEPRYVDTWVSYPGRYKGSDTFACMGPWLTTADAIPDPHKLAIACHHQGRTVTEDNTGNLTYKTAEVIAFVSRYMTLWPGDIISLGTALRRSAIGGAVQNIDLAAMGGPVSVSIEGIGTLSNGVRMIEETRT
ncbi:MAG: fumarylacetoacetate hydrolase family protein [Pigmentiphaga sp.]|nr:fumarylacetoacetate hydrolase family protein [Pigmentiphaga sp.]